MKLVISNRLLKEVFVTTIPSTDWIWGWIVTTDTVLFRSYHLSTTLFSSFEIDIDQDLEDIEAVEGDRFCLDPREWMPVLLQHPDSFTTIDTGRLKVEFSCKTESCVMEPIVPLEVLWLHPGSPEGSAGKIRDPKYLQEMVPDKPCHVVVNESGLLSVGARRSNMGVKLETPLVIYGPWFRLLLDLIQPGCTITWGPLITVTINRGFVYLVTISGGD